MKTLFDRVFTGNDAMYALAVKAVDEAIAKLGADAPATFGDTAYSLPCLYAMTGKKVATIGEAKEALETTVKEFMTRNKRTKDIFTSHISFTCDAFKIFLSSVATTISAGELEVIPTEGILACWTTHKSSSINSPNKSLTHFSV